MGADHSVHKGDDDETVAKFHSSDSIHGEGEDPEGAIERKRSQQEYDRSVWLQDELSKERRLHRGISENIILEDFRRGMFFCLFRNPSAYQLVQSINHHTPTPTHLPWLPPQIHDPESEEIALRCFNSLLIFAGLENKGGFEEPGDTGMVLLVQNVIQYCASFCPDFITSIIFRLYCLAFS